MSVPPAANEMSRIPLVEQCHRAVAPNLDEGDTAIDATVGNGNDTLFLARRVGETGRVHGFDVQTAALEHTVERLAAEGMAHRVQLHHCGHEQMAARLTPPPPVRAVLFNLGYLPGSDKARATGPGTTLEALEAARALLVPGGVIAVVAYTGHPGGREEADAVRRWMAGLPTGWRVESILPKAGRRSPPELHLAFRLRDRRPSAVDSV